MVTSEVEPSQLQDVRRKPERITSSQLKTMKNNSNKSLPLTAWITKSLTGFWSYLNSTLSIIFASKRSSKTFCEQNGHSIIRVAGSIHTHCRYCDAEIQSVDMLTSPK